MTDRELYNHIKATYKPEKGTALFFDLRNYHICGLHPRVLETGTEIEFNCFETVPQTHFAVLDYLGNELRYEFSYKEFHQEENLSTFKVLYYKKVLKYDLEQLKKEFSELISFLQNSQVS